MKIAFFLFNGSLGNVDWNTVDESNPGVGGTEYLFVLNAYLLSKRKEVEIVLYTEQDNQFPQGMHVVSGLDAHSAIIDAANKNADFFVIKEFDYLVNEKVLENTPSSIGIVLWTHIFVSVKRLNYYAKIPNLKSIIMVGREQLDLYRGHPLFEKMDYIYNGCTFPPKSLLSKELQPVSNRDNIVTYIGSLVPFKGFHVLAKAWPMILKSVPDAQLYVIGTGKLYDRNARLGSFGIASEDYEAKFMKFLTDKDGKILPSVHFMGRLGLEKNDILKKTKVGVPNPLSKTETFGLGAIEMQTFGCCVVTSQSCGYLDTVVHKKNLYRFPWAICLASKVIRNLRSPNFDFDHAYDEMKSKFDAHDIATQWVHLFYSLSQGKCRIHNLDYVPNRFYRLKWLRVLMQRVNSRIHYTMPCLLALTETRVYNKILHYYRKLY